GISFDPRSVSCVDWPGGRHRGAAGRARRLHLRADFRLPSAWNRSVVELLDCVGRTRTDLSCLDARGGAPRSSPASARTGSATRKTAAAWSCLRPWRTGQQRLLSRNVVEANPMVRKFIERGTTES